MVNEKPNPKKFKRLPKSKHSRVTIRRSHRSNSRNSNSHSSANIPDKRYTIGNPIINVPSSPLTHDEPEDDKNAITKEGD